jgi:hypothetical protein
VVQVPLDVFNRTTRVWGGTKDYHSALQGGHSTLNTVVLGEGVYQSPNTPPTLATIAAVYGESKIYTLNLRPNLIPGKLFF